nr:uncharacterized mitochondrial protein AtMg00810-like [Tanacetum cinerariifolium]
MDEATASIDSDTDAIVKKIIRQEYSRCTILTVAHRIPTVIDRDMVMVVENRNHTERKTWFPDIEPLFKLLSYENVPPYLKGALRDSIATLIHVYDMIFELNEVEARSEHYLSTISFFNLLNSLIAEERDATDRGGRVLQKGLLNVADNLDRDSSVVKESFDKLDTSSDSSGVVPLLKTLLEAKPTEKHLTAVKRIFRYLKDTIHIGLWYSKDTGFELTSFSDSDHAGCLDSCKSTSGGIQFLGGDKLVSWSSKKQDCTSMYSAEAEYVSLSVCCAQVLWLRTQLTDYGFHFNKIPMYCDSKATIAISCNPV